MDEPTGSRAHRGPVLGADQGPGPAGEDAWAAAAAAVLRKAGRLAGDAPDDLAWDRLARRTVEDLLIPPLGTRSRAAGLPTAAALASGPGQPPFLRGITAQSGGWDVRAHLADPDPAAANRSALGDLEGGVTSLWVRIGDGGTRPDDLPAVLEGVHLDAAPVMLDPAHPDLCLPAARVLDDLARTLSAPLHPDGTLGADPVGAVADAGLAGEGIGRAPGTPEALAATVFRDLPDILGAARDLGVRAIVVDGLAAHAAGAGDAGELGYTLAAGAACVRAMVAAGLDVDAACRLLEFRYAATDDQFVTIAKLRAARLAWHRVAELSGATPDARAQRQHAVTSPAMLTRYDPWVNLLRTTVAAFAAGVGGAAAVTVLPFDSALGIPDEFGRRMARNISTLLVAESHVAAVADPAGGAHAVEMLTAGLAEAAWAEFGRIESSGGVLAALADGSLARRTAQTRAERDRRIATRRQPITGVSEFPNAAERAGALPPRRPAPPTGRFPRWAEPFEMLRDHPPADPVVLVTIGTPAAAAARLLFTRNLLAAGGIAVVEPEPGTTVEQAVAQSGCRTVVLAGSDADYADSGLAAASAAARTGGATTVLLAGRPAALLADLPDGSIDAAFAAGDDVLEFLRSARTTVEGASR